MRASGLGIHMSYECIVTRVDGNIVTREALELLQALI